MPLTRAIRTYDPAWLERYAEMLRRAITVGIEDWRSGRLDDRPIDEILDEIDRDEPRSPPA